MVTVHTSESQKSSGGRGTTDFRARGLIGSHCTALSLRVCHNSGGIGHANKVLSIK
jgi:hypothetical protein